MPSDTFWISFAGICAGVISGGLVYIGKSKCKSFNCCWGGLGCVRDTQAEVSLEEFRIDHNVPESPTLRNNTV